LGGFWTRNRTERGWLPTNSDHGTITGIDHGMTTGSVPIQRPEGSLNVAPMSPAVAVAIAAIRHRPGKTAANSSQHQGHPDASKDRQK
jgi:hypothetical protein